MEVRNVLLPKGKNGNLEMYCYLKEKICEQTDHIVKTCCIIKQLPMNDGVV